MHKTFTLETRTLPLPKYSRCWVPSSIPTSQDEFVNTHSTQVQASMLWALLSSLLQGPYQSWLHMSGHLFPTLLPYVGIHKPAVERLLRTHEWVDEDRRKYVLWSEKAVVSSGAWFPRHRTGSPEHSIWQMRELEGKVPRLEAQGQNKLPGFWGDLGKEEGGSYLCNWKVSVDPKWKKRN